MAADRLDDGAFQDNDEHCARALDAADPLAHFRERFCIPRTADGRDAIYFCGNSLGLQPRTTRKIVTSELDAWEGLAVDAHFHGDAPWYSYHELVRDSAARLVGARPDEVVCMNSLTVNLHLMLATFYRPSGRRTCILIEDPAFPSDTYAVKSHVAQRGLDPRESVLVLRPRPGEQVFRTEDVEEFLERQGERIGVVLLGGVNFLTGQVLDMPRITAAARRHGCIVGWDLAHAAGNVELRLHDWDVDFAAWCSYKYLNAGPGGIAGCFIHERHARDTALPRFGGWWGNDPKTRFRMHLESEFKPVPSADAWQLSNPPIFALAPLRASLSEFDAAGMPALRAKAQRLTAYLQGLVDRLPAGRFEVVTPREVGARGCQLSILVRDRPRDLQRALQAAGVVSDFREPNIIRVAPVPLYNTFHDVWRFAQVLAAHA